MERTSSTGARIAGTVRAPWVPLDRIGPWFNGTPRADWRGAATLVDFWTYSCINCLRTLPALRAWHERYAAAGLTILGVHTPEFPFEREPENVARALRELGVAYPVVLDNERALWTAFANRVWPHRYLIDSAGRIVHDHAGERGEAATEQAIRAALASDGCKLPPPAFLAEDGSTPLSTLLVDEDTPGAVCRPGSPELFAGYYRGVSGNVGGFREDLHFDYRDASDRREGHINLTGRWRVGADAAEFVGPGAGMLQVAFRGTAPNIVMAPSGDAPIEVAVSVETDDEVRVNTAQIVVDAPRLYRLPPAVWAGADDAALRTLTLASQLPGLAVYSFTFAACT